MKTKIMKRFLSVMLAAFMLVSLIPGQAYAATNYVNTFDIRCDWSQIKLVENMNYQSFIDTDARFPNETMTYSGTNIDVNACNAEWQVQVDDTWLITNPSDYNDRQYNTLINEAMQYSNNWAPLYALMERAELAGENYIINSQDTYGLRFDVRAEGANEFSISEGNYTGTVTGNVPNVDRAYIFLNGTQRILLYVPLTLADITNAKNQPACEHANKTSVDGSAATCTDNGVVAHVKCNDCGKTFDANGTEIADVVIPAGHDIASVDRQAPTCSAVGYELHYKCNRCNKLFSDNAGANEITAPTEIPADDDAHVFTILRCDERGHWYECSACGELNADLDYSEQDRHTDGNSDNKCDVCDYVVYHVTLNANGYRVLQVSILDSHEYRVDVINGDTFLVPANAVVEIIGGSPTLNEVIAPGATASLVVAEGGTGPSNACKVSNFTRNTTIVLNPTPGNVEVTEEVEDEAPIQDVQIKNDIDDFINNSNVFEESEIVRILTGENAKVWLDVNELINVPTEDKTEIEGKVAELGVSEDVTYFDASFFKQVGTDTPQSISEPGMNIEITIKIPTELLNTDSSKTRTYYLLRYHTGEPVEAINGSFSNGEFTFTTNKFSTYAIVYKDVAKNTGSAPGAGSGSGSGSGSSDSSSSSSSSSTTTTSTTTATATQQLVKDDVPKTGETADYTTLVWTSILAIGVLGLVLNRQKRRQ